MDRSGTAGERGGPGRPDRSGPARADVSGLRALAHPVRLRLLSLLTGAELSAAEAARELGLTQANVSYHLRVLHAAGLVQPAGEVVVRGGRAHRFRHDPASGRGPMAGPEEHRELAAVLGAELRRRTVERLPGARGLVADAELQVPEEVWESVRAEVDAAVERLHRAAAPPRTPGTVRVSATVSLFRMREPAARGEAGGA